MKSIGIFEAKTHFTAVCDEVVRTGVPTVVSKRGKPLVLVVPAPSQAARPDILAAWRQWEATHPEGSAEPDFPDVVRLRGAPKPDPLTEE